MNNTTAWAVLSGSVLRLLRTKQLGFELLNKNTALELHMTQACADNFPVVYTIKDQTTLQRDLSQLNKDLTLKIRNRFQCLLTDCLVLSESSGSIILRVGGYYGYFQRIEYLMEFLERLQHELECNLPDFDESYAEDFFTAHDSIIEGFFTASVHKNKAHRSSLLSTSI